MAIKKDLHVGDRVEFSRTHDKGLKLTGTILAIHEAHDVVEITTDVDGRIIEVPVVSHAHISDVRVLTKAEAREKETEAKENAADASEKAKTKAAEEKGETQ